MSPNGNYSEMRSQTHGVVLFPGEDVLRISMRRTIRFIHIHVTRGLLPSSFLRKKSINGTIVVFEHMLKQMQQ